MLMEVRGTDALELESQLVITSGYWELNWGLLE